MDYTSNVSKTSMAQMTGGYCNTHTAYPPGDLPQLSLKVQRLVGHNVHHPLKLSLQANGQLHGSGIVVQLGSGKKFTRKNHQLEDTSYVSNYTDHWW